MRVATACCRALVLLPAGACVHAARLRFAQTVAAAFQANHTPATSIALKTAGAGPAAGRGAGCDRAVPRRRHSCHHGYRWELHVLTEGDVGL